MSVIEFQNNKSGGAACWRTHGTWSAEPTCEKLKFVTHCRNCDVFENAARQSWEKKNNKNESGLTVFSIEDLIEKEKTAGDRSVLPFRIGEACFAVPSESILTITDHVAIHTVPFNKNPVLKGLVAINNEIYSMVNLAQLLKITVSLNNIDSQKVLYKRVVVLNMGQRSIAFHVDEVHQIHRYFEKFLRDVEESDRSCERLSKGVLDNFGQWDTDCCLLDLDALQQHFENELSA